MTAAPVLGRYELVRKIAAGGMAEVFLARQRGPAGFARALVLKRLFRHLVDTPKTLRMFQDEAKVLAVFNHPNIAQVYELGCHEGQWYIAMEHVQGPDLAAICRYAAPTMTTLILLFPATGSCGKTLVAIRRIGC